ncbi:MAG TPA: hypothetical protein VFA18_24170 [Gemmataceae bacterium]|nr:hypothetical protein [Gemmataceae bacterium]
MNSLPWPEIDVLDVPGGVQYRLPRRPTSVSRFGQLSTVFGLGVGVPLLVFAAVEPFAAPMAQAGGPLAEIFRVIAVLGALHFIALAGHGLRLWVGRSEIRFCDGRLAAVERLGPFRFVRWRAVPLIDQVVVIPARSSSAIPPDEQQAPTCLRALCWGRRPFTLARGYPEACLSPLAFELNRHLAEWKLQTIEPMASAKASTAELTRSELPARPAGSLVVVKYDREYAQVTMPKPEVGLHEGMLVFAALETLGMALFLALILLVGKAQGDIAAAWFAVAFLVGLGLTMIGLVIRTFRQQVVLLASPSRLALSSQGLFLRSLRWWPRQTIRGIVARRIGPEYGTLSISLVDGREVVLLKERPQAEVDWIAAVLRQPLGLRDSQPDGPPLGCAIQVQRDDDGLIARIPAAGFCHRRQITLLTVALAFLCLACLVAVAAAQSVGQPSALLAWLFLCVAFTGIGLLILTAALRAAQEQAVLAVTGNRLFALFAWTLGGRRYEWARDELASIQVAWRAGAGQFAVRIEPTCGPSLRLLERHREEDLQWLVAALRSALHIPEASGTVNGGVSTQIVTIPHLPGERLARALSITQAGTSLRLTWSNRRAPKDWSLVVVLLLAWVFFTPVTALITLGILLGGGIGFTVFLAILSSGGWLVTLLVLHAFLGLFWTESFEITPATVGCRWRGLLAPRPKTCPIDLRPTLSFGHRGGESSGTFNLEWTLPSGQAKQVPIGQWLAEDCKEDLFLTIVALVRAHDIPLAIKRFDL